MAAAAGRELAALFVQKLAARRAAADPGGAAAGPPPAAARPPSVSHARPCKSEFALLRQPHFISGSLSAWSVCLGSAQNAHILPPSPPQAGAAAALEAKAAAQKAAAAQNAQAVQAKQEELDCLVQAKVGAGRSNGDLQAVIVVPVHGLPGVICPP